MDRHFDMHDMNTSGLETEARIVHVDVLDTHVVARLSDGRVISAPLEWYPRLLHATAAERSQYDLGAGGYGIHWPCVDEDISVDNLLEGRRSGESQRSLQRWLTRRRRSRSQLRP